MVGVAGEPLIRLAGVSFAYKPGHPVLADVHLELRRGERLGLVGPNGSGKTTCLHLIVGLLLPQAGVVWAFGRERTRERDFAEVRARVGLVFQNPDDQLFCPTVLEDVAFGPLNLGWPREKALAAAAGALALVGCGELGGRVTHHLSHGEKRLVALATVLAMEPEVLLLDEPTNGLDEVSCERVGEILAALPQAMILVSHQRDFLQPLVHRRQSLGSTPLAGAAG
mgnify:CR=1 FL=1